MLPESILEPELDDLPIDGEMLEESDLVDAAGPEFVLPDQIDQGELLDWLYRDLRRGEQAKAVLAEAQMRKVIDLNKQLEHRTMNGLGAVAARIPLDVYLYWTAREGYEFWQQPDTLDYFEKRAGQGQGNPGFKIKSTTGRTVVTVDHQLPAHAEPDIGVKGKRPAGGKQHPPAASVPQRKLGRRGRWAT